MTASLFLRIAIRPALELLPPKMNTPEAQAMLLAIALQESRCCHRRQINGPARGMFQFEIGGVRGVLSHARSKPHLAAALTALSYPVTDDATVPYVAMEHNDVLAAVCARLLLWTLPAALPTKDDPEAGWQQYIAAWRPGKPHRQTWDGYYRQAWELAEPA